MDKELRRICNPDSNILNETESTLNFVLWQSIFPLGLSVKAVDQANNQSGLTGPTAFNSPTKNSGPDEINGISPIKQENSSDRPRASSMGSGGSV